MPSVLHSSLYSSAQVRALDQCAITDFGLPGHVLMKRAGKAAFELLLARWPQVKTVHVFCGAGNNGGDGYVIAALVAQKGLCSFVWQLSTQLSDTATQAHDYALQEGVKVQPFAMDKWQQCLNENDEAVIVDALLGTGTSGPLRDNFKEAITAINSVANQKDWPVLAIDIPSGVNPDNGSIVDNVIQAEATISFIGQKLGNVIGCGRLASGERFFNDLDIPHDVYEQSKQEPIARTLDLMSLLPLIPKRTLDAHKGDFGHVLVVGGDLGYGGAPLMAAQMAARSGAGLVGVATQPHNTHAMIARQPELMVAGVVSGQELLPLLNKPDILVVGPGLGQTAWSEQLLYHCLHSEKPMVIDADGLNILAQGRLQLPEFSEEKIRPWILTPHPGEAARLLGISINEVQQDRLTAIHALQTKYGGAVILKGAGSLVLTSDQRLFVCDAGNPGMASGGMGDVLSGLLGALLAQGLSVDDAACLGTILHATAADEEVAENGSRGLLATDLITTVRQLLNC